MNYFYDLSLLDVRGELSAALTVLYYGNEVGAFSGPNKKMLDLSDVHAVEIELTNYASNDDGVHSYSLMFFERNWNEEVWKKKLLEKKHNLKSITTRVTLTSKISMNPKHEHHLFTASNRYIDFAQYPELAVSHIVPAEYVTEFNARFIGYLMRSERSFEDVHAMLSKYQLSNLVDENYHSDDVHQHVSVAAYGMMKKTAIA